MRVSFVASLTALLACLLLMVSSYFQSIFWNVTRRPLPDDRDSIIFVHSVVGNLKLGYYAVDKDTDIRLTIAFDAIQDGHDDFRFNSARKEHGLPRAFLYFDSSHINSKFLSIHYAAIALPILSLSVFLYVLIARSQAASTKSKKEAEQDADGTPH